MVDPHNLPDTPVPPHSFDLNLLKLNISNFEGEGVDVTFQTDKPLANPTVWKFNPQKYEWYTMPFVKINETTIQITITDGGLGDDDGIKNGIIIDDVGISQDNTWLYIGDDSDTRTAYAYQDHYFYANYSDNTTNNPIADGNCSIKENSTGSWNTNPMTYNATSKLHEFTTSFNNTGTHEYNISCDSLTYTNVSLAEDFTVTLNTFPTLSDFLLQTEGNTNCTEDDLQLNFTLSDVEGDDYYTTVDWRENGSSIARVHFDFNENISSTGSGDLKDMTTFKNNASLGGGSAAPVWEPSGVVGGAYHFDGGDDYIIIPTSPTLGSLSEVTLEAWAYFDVATQLSGAPLIQVNSRYLTRVSYLSGKVQVTSILYPNATLKQLSSDEAESLTANEWHYIVTTYNGSMIKLYLDGVLVNELSATGDIPAITTQYMTFGGTGSVAVDGLIDEVAVYPVALTQEQINRTYHEVILGTTPNFLDSSLTTLGDNWSATLNTQENSREINYSNNILITCYNDNNPTLLESKPTLNISNYTTYSLINFSCNFSDDYGLTNISLNITNSSNSNWHKNQTTAVTGTNALAWWELNLTNGYYTWTCIGEDNANQTTYGMNKTINLSLDHQSPNITSIFVDPTNVYFNTIFKIKTNITENNEIDTVLVDFNGTNHTMTLVNGIYEKEFNASVYGGGDYNITIYVNDTWSNVDKDNTTLHINDKYSSDVNFTINNQKTDVVVGIGELIKINATLISPSSLSPLELYRNGTSLINSSNNVLFNESYWEPNVYNYTVIFPGNSTVSKSVKTIIVSVEYSAKPIINFTGLTPANNSIQNTSSVTIEYTTSSSINYSSFIDINGDLLGYWNFEDDYGTTAVDWSSHNVDGDIIGTTKMRSDAIRGKYLFFDGNDEINMSPGPMYLGTGFTIEAWVKEDSSGDSGASIINLNGANGLGLQHSLDNTKYEFFFKTNVSTYDGQGFPSSGIDGKWHHVLGLFTQNRLKLYIDSKQVRLLATEGIIPTQDAMMYIARSETGRYFNGSLDEIRLWNRTMSLGEIDNLYNGTGLGSETYELSEGINNIRVCVSDLEGRVTCKLRVITIDTQYPVLALNRTGSEIYNRTLDIPLRVVVNDDSTQSVNATVTWNDSFNSQTISLTEINGVYQANFTQTDRMDNFNITYSAQDGLGRVTNLSEIITTAPLSGDTIYINFKGATTNFNALPNNGDVANAILEKPNIARINWYNNINATSQDFDAEITIEKGLISVNSESLDTSINSSANLIFYGGNWLEPLIYRNGELCTSCDLNYYDGENISFNVTSFSTYTVVDATNLTIWDESDSRFVFNATNNTFYANYTNTTSGEAITGADVECNFTENSAGTWSTPATMSYINSVYQINKTFANNGTYQFNVSCVNNQEYANLTVTDDFTIYPDMVTELTILNTTMNISNPKEGDSVLLSVNISNLGELNGTNFTLNLNVSSYNGTKIFTYSNETLVNLLEAGTTKIINFTWIATIGTTIFDLYVDSYNNITEVDETNNTYSINITVDSWSVFYGNLSTTLILGDSNNKTLFDWTSTPFGWMLISDVDASYLVDNLEPLTSADLIDLDNALNMTGFNDSVKNMYDANDDGVSDIFMNITLFGRNITNIPARKLDPSSDFLTGILFDSADGASFTGSEDVVFIVQMNDSLQGTYGLEDYEIVFPAALRKQSGFTDEVLYQLQFD